MTAPEGLNPTPDDFGATLFAYRSDADISQAQLARSARLSRSYLSEMENGRRPPPKSDVVLRLAKALGLSKPRADILVQRAAAGRSSPDLKTANAILALIADLGTYAHQLRPADVNRVRAQIKEMLI